MIPPTEEHLRKYLEKVSSKVYSAQSPYYQLQAIRRCFSLLPGLARAKTESLFFRNPKETSKVKKSYEQVWSAGGVPDTLITVQYKNKIYEVSALEEKRIQCWVLTDIFRPCEKSKILEVGSGNGLMALSLQRALPRHLFYGLELTKNGCRQSYENLTPAKSFHSDYRKEKSDDAAQSTGLPKYLQGSAAHLPLDSKSMDFTYTVLALEQMNPIFVKVICEIRRVTKQTAYFLEPFIDFNTSMTRRLYIQSRSYLNKKASALKELGFEILGAPVVLPSKVYRGYGLIKARPQRS